MNATIGVPRPRGKLLYLKLRDDPSVIHTLEMPLKKDPPLANKELPAKDDKPSAQARQKISDSANPPIAPAPQ
jgi:hypothetical protein